MSACDKHSPRAKHHQKKARKKSAMEPNRGGRAFRRRNPCSLPRCSFLFSRVSLSRAFISRAFSDRGTSLAAAAAAAAATVATL